MQNKTQQEGPKFRHEYLTPIDLKVVTISKEYKINKLVIETKEGHTVHLLFDELPEKLIKDIYQYVIIGLPSEVEKILRKKVLTNYKVYVEFDKTTKNIELTPFLVENFTTTNDEFLYVSPEWKRYLRRNCDHSLLPEYLENTYKIDEINFLKKGQHIQIISNLTNEQFEATEKIIGKTFAPLFGDLDLDDNKLIITLHDILSAFPYNAIVKANESNNILDLVKENNDIKIISASTSSIEMGLPKLKVLNFSYVSKNK